MEQKAIKIEGLSYIYDAGSYALKDINLEIAQNEFVAIIGQNGAGKSTLLKNITGLLKPSSGKIMLKGICTSGIPVAKLATQIGFVLQNPDQQLFAATVWDEIAFGPKNLGLSSAEIKGRVEQALEWTGIAGYAAEFPPALSKGDRAKVVIASVLAMRPEIIILDEPTSGQDYKGCCQIMNIARNLHQAGHTLIVVTHQMSLVAEYAQRAIVLCQGEVLLDAGTKDVFAQPEELRKTELLPPQITQLGYDLGQGLPLAGTFLSTRELGDELLRIKQNFEIKTSRTGTEG